jgi:putative toxin-antitoxin system antitoxin component (TIGR02293 family)
MRTVAHSPIPALSAAKLLGGKLVFTIQPKSLADWISAIRKGLPAGAIDALLQNTHLSQAQLSTVLAIPERTLARRKREGILTSEESDKLVRLARIIERAEEIFEGLSPALDWLQSPNHALNGELPINFLDTDIGAENVLDTLGRIEHGVFA